MLEHSIATIPIRLKDVSPPRHQHRTYRKSRVPALNRNINRSITTPRTNDLGSISYVTGGTTAAPRVISYDYAKRARSVDIKARILSAHGVGANARLAVLLPFAPWSIGDIHVQAGLKCGANVFPLGIGLNDSALADLLASFNPTHVCAGARNLIRWANAGANHSISTERVAFVSGERLESSVRAAVRTSWNAKVVNVYGMAEFDAIASEFDTTPGLILAPDYEYCIYGNITETLREGLEGRLGIREVGSTRWYDTKDLIRVLGKARFPGSIVDTWAIEYLNRDEDFVSFPDGSAIGAEQLDLLLSHFPTVTDHQLQVWELNGLDSVRLVVTNGNDAAPIPDQALYQALISSNIDFADALSHGIIHDVAIVQTSRHADYIETARGKRPRFTRVKTAC